MDTINHADQCVGESMLSWVFYPNREASKSCFVYPQYLFSENDSYLIEESAFPERGSFIAGTTGRYFASDLKDRYGELVVATVDADTFPENEKHGRMLLDGRQDENKYYAQINPDLPYSTLKFRRFGDDPISNRLVQVIEIEATEKFESPFTKPVFLSDARSVLFLDEVIVRQNSDDGSVRYYGPFLCSKNQDGSLTLAATEAHDYRIFSFGNIPAKYLMPVWAKRGFQEEPAEEEMCTFLEKAWIEKGMEDALATNSAVIDWLPENELLKSFNRVINAARESEFKELGGSALTSLKNAVRSYGDMSLLPKLDEGRKQRLCKILTDVETLAASSEDLLHRAFNEIDEERLASIVDKNYPYFEERLLESSGVRQKLDDAIKKIDSETDSAIARRDQYVSEAEQAREDRDRAIEAAEQAKRDAEKVQKEALGKIQEELDGLDKEIASKRCVLDDLNRKSDDAAANKMRIEKEINQIIDNLDDEITSSSKILESEILRKVVRKVNGATLDSESTESQPSEWKIREDEAEMSSEEVIEDIANSISEIGGRDVTRNYVVNLMTCLMQGYITTFAGLPGTGKTSLCNILAGSLGLLSKENPRERFTEINVENGWTSYKDYIGYWNPITKSYEQSNAAIYEAMRCLTREDGSRVPPYVFLLDEANLSSIEHYWSPFLRAADSFLEKGADLPLGGSTSWNLPSHMRFLATVNFDHTTEELSKRFLDRSWVITLPPRTIDAAGADNEGGKGFEDVIPFSYEKLMEVFYSKDAEITDQLIASLYGKLIAICQDRKYPISPRSQLMMRRYIATATRLMHAELTNFRYAPLDFAFSQKVLPSISGTRESVAPLVNELIENCQQLEVTLAQLERMKKYGDESGFYQYFI